TMGVNRASSSTLAVTPRVITARKTDKLSRRPIHRPPTQQVEVKVIDGLATVRSGIDHQAVSAVELPGPGHLADRPEQMSEQVGIAGGRLGVRADVLLRNHQNMRGRLRVDVRKGQHTLILVKPFD